MSRLIVIEDFATAREAMRVDSFYPVDLAGYLRLLQAESGVDLTALIHLADNTPFFLHGPRHQMLHLLSARFLVASRIEAWRPTMEAAVETHLDCLQCIKSPDLVRDFVNPVFRFITGLVLGFDATTTNRFDHWIKQARDLLEPLRSLRQISRLQTTIGEMMEYIAGSPPLVSLNSPSPVREQLEGELSKHFTRQDALALVTVLFVASQTTSQTLSKMILYVLRLPEETRSALSGPRGSVWFDDQLETLFRLHASPQFVDRIAKKDQQIGTSCFGAGDHLHIHLPTVNRDKAMFPEDTKCPARRIASAGHLSFGAGAHKCPGATYARMAIGIALPRLFARFPGISLSVDEPEWENTTFIQAPTSLPCRL